MLKPLCLTKFRLVKPRQTWLAFSLNALFSLFLHFSIKEIYLFKCYSVIEYGEILCIAPHSVRMRGNADQNNSEYGHFLKSVIVYLLQEQIVV